MLLVSGWHENLTGLSIRGQLSVARLIIFTYTAPSGRWGHDMCLIDKRKAVLIGGQGSKLQMAKDSVWTLDLTEG